MAPESEATLLSGIAVLELGAWMAVPFAGKLLGDLGAEVTKIEFEGGDQTRAWGPFPNGAQDPEHSALFAYLNTSKRGEVTPRTSSAADLVRGREQAPQVILLDQIFLGEDPAATVAAVRAAAPSAVLVTVTPFGVGGPYGGFRGYDITSSAAGGISYGVGDRNRAPLPLPFGQSDRQAGLCAAIAALMAILPRLEVGGRGEHVDISIQHVMAALHSGYFLTRYIFSGGVVGLRNGRAGGAQPYPHTVLPCKDGLVTLVAPKVDQWIRFLELMGTPEWSKEPRYRNRRAMQWEYKEEVDAKLIPWFAEHTQAELMQMFVKNRIPFAPILNGHELIETEHLRQREAVMEHEFPGGGTFLAPLMPYTFGRSYAVHRRAPRLGEHGQAPLASADESHSTQPDRAAAGTPAIGPGPLAGVRVLDLGTAWAGGIVGRILGDFGADVIKVESWSHMDGSRMGKPIVVDDADGGDSGSWPDLQPGFHVHGRSKRSVALNLRSERGMEILLELAAQSDVVVHNFTPQVVRSLGVTPERLRAANPRLIVVGQSVAGDQGPLSHYTGYATTVGSLAGFVLGIGYEGEEPIASLEGIFTDVISATMSVYAAVAALIERKRSGDGQAIDVSQWQAQMLLAPEPVIEYSTTGAIRQSEGFSHPLLSPHGNYAVLHDPDDETQTGAWISIAIGSDQEWQGLLEAVGDHGPPAPDAASWSLEHRRIRRAEIDTWLTRWTQQLDVDSVQALLQQHGVAAFRVANVADIFVDPQLMSREAFISLEHPLVGSEPMPGLPFNFADAPCAVQRRAPLLGEHTSEVLAELIGLSENEIEELVESGAIELPPRKHDEAGV